jgi:hypothetical protein
VAWWELDRDRVGRSAAAARGCADVTGEDRVLELLRALRNGWIEVAPSEEVRQQAQRLLRVHALRAAEAFQLAAALMWAGRSSDATLVTFDKRLALAASLEAFKLVP